jgi:SsrA-binding protein
MNRPAWQPPRPKRSQQRDGMTLIVTQCYFKANRAKLEIAIARGRKSYDKRQAIKERDMAKEARDAINRGKRR